MSLFNFLRFANLAQNLIIFSATFLSHSNFILTFFPFFEITKFWYFFLAVVVKLPRALISYLSSHAQGQGFKSGGAVLFLRRWGTVIQEQIRINSQTNSVDILGEVPHSLSQWIPDLLLKEGWRRIRNNACKIAKWRWCQVCDQWRSQEVGIIDLANGGPQVFYHINVELHWYIYHWVNFFSCPIILSSVTPGALLCHTVPYLSWLL